MIGAKDFRTKLWSLLQEVLSLNISARFARAIPNLTTVEEEWQLLNASFSPLSTPPWHFPVECWPQQATSIDPATFETFSDSDSDSITSEDLTFESESVFSSPLAMLPSLVAFLFASLCVLLWRVQSSLMKR